MTPPAPFLEACLRRPTPFTPVWLMRQAGRYMPEYRALRARHGFLELCKTPAAAAEVTLQPIERLGVDAAILFADILLVLEPLGVGLEFTKGDGPRIQRPVRSAEDVRRMPTVDVAEAVGYVFETVRIVRKALDERVPLIGFAGAPFTLASYLIEGGPSREFLATKRFMREERTAWDALLTRLADVTAEYLNGQIAAGAQAVQLFDSWVGALSPSDYREHVLPYSQRAIRGLVPGVPVIHFGTGTATLLPLMKEAGGDVIGLDWRVEIGPTWERLGHDVAVQGNLDPADSPVEHGGDSPRGAGRSSTRWAGGPATSSISATASTRRRRWTTSSPSSTSSTSCPRDERRRLGAADRVRRARAIRGHPPVPRDRHGGPAHSGGAPRGGGAPLRADRRALAAERADAPPGRRARTRARAGGHRPARPRRHAELAPVPARDARGDEGRRPSARARHHPVVAPDRGLVGALRGRRRGGARARSAPARPRSSSSPAWGDHPLFIAAMAERVDEALARVPPARRSAAAIVFTAHSVPVAMASGSPYAAQLEAAARSVAEHLAHPRWSVAYQSRSGSPRDPWLEPDIGAAIRDLARGGAADVVVAPIGFVCDHVEVLYDLDVEARAVAADVGIGFHRAAAANDHPAFIAMLVDLVRQSAGGRPTS